MKDRELEEKLKMLKEEVQRELMQDLNFSAGMRANVHKMANSSRRASGFTTGGSGRLCGTSILKFLVGFCRLRKAYLTAAAACFILLFLVVFAQSWDSVNTASVEERQIAAGGKLPAGKLPSELHEALGPDGKSAARINYVAVIWVVPAGGNGQDVVYCSSGEESGPPLFMIKDVYFDDAYLDVAYPERSGVFSGKVVGSPGFNGNLVILPSQGKQADFLSCLLKNSGPEVKILDRAFAPQGQGVENVQWYVVEKGAAEYSLFRREMDRFVEEAASRSH